MMLFPLILVTVTVNSALHAQVTCASTLTQDTRLTEDLICQSDGPRLAAPGIALDCAGHTIRGGGRVNTIGVAAIGVAGVTVRNCDLAGFWVPLYLRDSIGSLVEKNKIVGDPYGRLYATGSPGLRVQDNTFVGPGANLSISYGPETQVRDNYFDPASGDPHEYISVSIYGSPRSVFTGNESDGTVYVAFSNHSDASLAAHNRLLGGSQIAIGHSTDSVITRNRIGPVDTAALSGPTKAGWMGTNLPSSYDETAAEDQTLPPLIAAGPAQSRRPRSPLHLPLSFPIKPLVSCLRARSAQPDARTFDEPACRTSAARGV